MCLSYIDWFCSVVCKEAILSHNYLRSAHEDTPPVTWNKQLADRAQAWAQECANRKQLENSGLNSEFRSQDIGENIYLGSSRDDILMTIACKIWYVFL